MLDPTTFHPVLDDKGPLRTLFVLTSMPIGGAETLLVNLIRRLDRKIIMPEVCCLKEKGPLGEELSEEVPVHSHLTRGKFDLRVMHRLVRLIKQEQYDCVVTVGAGDKMFWGRLAAWRCSVPVICSALHSTGWPDGVGRLNRMLTRITDGFIAVAKPHGRFLVEQESFPQDKVFVIPNGIDTDRFCPQPKKKRELRHQLDLSSGVKLVSLVAALRPEKNHGRFLRVAKAVQQKHPDAQFLIVGDGPERNDLEELARSLGIAEQVHFLGSRSDTPDVLAASDLFLLTSDNEASPVSILEAMACQLPVVASRVGSVAQMVVDDETGFCVEPTDESQFASHVDSLLSDDQRRIEMGQLGRARVVERGSLNTMVHGYEDLLAMLYCRKTGNSDLVVNSEQRRETVNVER